MKEEKMICGLFSDSYKPIPDGVANVVSNYALWIQQKYGQSYVVSPSSPGHEDTELYKVLRYPSLAIPQRKPYRLGISQFDLDFNTELTALPLQIIHAHSPFSAGTLALKEARRRNIPIIATFHSKYYDDFKASLKSDILAKFALSKVMQFFGSVDQVWAVNHNTADVLRSYGFKKEILVVDNGCDMEIVKDSRTLRKAVNQKLGLKEEELIFLFVGQHIWHKNIKLIVDSLNLLKKQGNTFKMLFVGSGPAKDELQTYIYELGLEKEILLMGNIMDRSYLQSIYARADLFIFPSLYDCSPITLKEAASVKCPGVVVKNSGSAEGITHDYNGFLTENNPQQLACTILNATADLRHLRNVGTNAQKTLVHSWESVVDEVNLRYKDLIYSLKTHYKCA
jgi:1,2-diacylglycerol 3-alpha-glucosyltransferase